MNDLDVLKKIRFSKTEITFINYMGKNKVTGLTSPELAKLFGCNKETVLRFIRKMNKNKIVSLKKKEFNKNEHIIIFNDALLDKIKTLTNQNDLSKLKITDRDINLLSYLLSITNCGKNVYSYNALSELDNSAKLKYNESYYILIRLETINFITWDKTKKEIKINYNNIQELINLFKGV